MVAYVKALRDYNKAFDGGGEKKEILAILAKYTGGDNAGIYERAVPVGLHPDGRLNVKSLEDDARWFVEHGHVKAIPQLGSIVDQSYVDFAVKTLGPFK